MDILIGRNGDSLTGKVLDRSLTIRSGLGALEVELRRIRWVHFRNPPEFERDELWLDSGDRVSGEIEGTGIRFKAPGGKTLEIPYASIHTIVVSPALDRNAPRLAA